MGTGAAGGRQACATTRIFFAGNPSGRPKTRFCYICAMSRVLYLDTDADRAALVASLLRGGPFKLEHAATAPQFHAAVQRRSPAVILLGTLPDVGPAEIVAAAHSSPAPVLLVDGDAHGFGVPLASLDLVEAAELWRLVPALRRAVARHPAHDDELAALAHYAHGMERVGALAATLARSGSIGDILAALRRAAREVVGADDVVVIKRTGDFIVVSGAGNPVWDAASDVQVPQWGSLTSMVLASGAPLVVADVDQDPHLKPESDHVASVGTTLHTVVQREGIRSLALLPVLVDPPSTVLVVLWKQPHDPAPRELSMLQAMANLVAVSLENVALVGGLERSVQEHTEALRHANAELETFDRAVAHDLRAPALNVVGFSEALLGEVQGMNELAIKHVQRISRSARLLVERVDTLLELARTVGPPTQQRSCDLTAIATEVGSALVDEAAPRRIEFLVSPELRADTDAGLFRVVLDNLLRNAVKFTGTRAMARIEVGFDPDAEAYFVRDNGVGFDPTRAEEMFRPFRRLHPQADFAGQGIGLATARRAVLRLGGRMWAEGAIDGGATIFFTIPAS